METLRLNVFQKLVRHWDALHPYNAAQIMHLNGAPDHSAIESAWRSALLNLGLGPVRVQGNRYQFQSLNGTIEQTQVAHIAEPIDSFITHELNRRFDDADPLPFRPFVLPLDGSFYQGVIYHHWVADSASVRLLIREWFYRLYDPARSRRLPLKMPQAGYWQNFGPNRGRWNLTESFFDILRWTGRMKHVKRIEQPDITPLATHFSVHQTREGLIDELLAAARRIGVTVNDLFLAVIAQACDRFVPVLETSKRRDLALGTIVDLRARGAGSVGGDALSDTFGLFLGFTNVICQPRQLRNWDQLLTHIAKRNREQKHRGEPEASMMRMFAGLVATRMLSPRKMRDFYRKRLPLTGGISNVNLNRSWAGEYHPAPLIDYIRVSPTGPMMPVVFTPTTLGRRLQFGLTCRDAVVPPHRATEIAEFFTTRLNELTRIS
jgi:hypothetical protein